MTHPAHARSPRHRLAAGLLLCVGALAGLWQAPLAGAGARPARAAAPKTAPAAKPAQPPDRALVAQYCVGCHNSRTRNGDLSLEGLDPAAAAASPEVWERVLRKLRVGLMPPVTARPLDAAARASFIHALESTIDAGAAAAPNPGRPSIHRLNRVEYANAVRDILALPIDTTTLLPADDAGFGFDNIGDALSVSPGLMERYIAAAERVAALAVGDPALGEDSQTFMVAPGVQQEERTSDDLSAGTRGGVAISHYFPLDGEYIIRIKLQSDPQFSIVRGLDFAHQIDVRLDGVRLRAFDFPALDRPGQQEAQTIDQKLEIRLPIRAGRHTLGVAIHDGRWYVESLGPERLPTTSFAYGGGTRTDATRGKQLMGVESVRVLGPFGGQRPADTPSRRALFTCRPAAPASELPCARRIVARLARRAYRRPVTERDLTALLRHYARGREGATFESGIQRTLEAVLVDPEFLFRIERDPAAAKPGSIYRVSDLELASRLSFFLWSSVPDEELLRVAAAGQLRAPGVLERQATRLLTDPKASAMRGNFFGQWLWLRNLARATPDAREFPEFDESLRAAFQREADLFLESQIAEDRSIFDLLTANYTFVNEPLARHYGIAGVYGSHFRRVQLPDDRRAGILGMGAILTVTSYANRTSPVLRGKWLLDTLLGVPPPTPPPNVPPFPENTDGARPASVRARMENHRKNPVCATCHAQLDPLGFALENFNAVGRWRVEDGGTTVDPSGMLPSGTKFSGPAEFRGALLAHRDAFALNLTQKLLTYALGRGVEYWDMPAVRQIARGTSAGDYRWSTLVRAIVTSTPFQMRKARG
jgi:mono/diheme cytochrome c family protein